MDKVNLLSQIELLQAEIDQQKKDISKEKKKLLLLESDLVFNKENLLKAKELLLKLNISSDFASLRDDARDREIERFRKFKENKDKEDISGSLQKED